MLTFSLWSPTCCHGGQYVPVNNLAWRSLPALTFKTLLKGSAETEQDQAAFAFWRACLPLQEPAALLQEEFPCSAPGMLLHKLLASSCPGARVLSSFSSKAAQWCGAWSERLARCLAGEYALLLQQCHHVCFKKKNTTIGNFAWQTAHRNV